MNYRLIQFQYENLITAAVSDFKYLTSHQLAYLFFPNKTLRACQAVLKRMAGAKMLKRFRHGSKFVYHVKAKDQKWRHTLLVNEFHFALLQSTKGEIAFEREHRVSQKCIADMKYTIDGKEFYLELDRGTNKYNFDKYPKHYTVVLVSFGKKREVPKNYIVTTIEEVRKKGLTLPVEKRRSHENYFEGGERSGFFQKSRKIRAKRD